MFFNRLNKFNLPKNILPVHPRNSQILVWNFLNIQPYGWVANFDVIRHPLRTIGEENFQAKKTRLKVYSKQREVVNRWFWTLHGLGFLLVDPNRL